MDRKECCEATDEVDKKVKKRCIVKDTSIASKKFLFKIEKSKKWVLTLLTILQYVFEGKMVIDVMLNCVYRCCKHVTFEIKWN